MTLSGYLLNPVTERNKSLWDFEANIATLAILCYSDPLQDEYETQMKCNRKFKNSTRSLLYEIEYNTYATKYKMENI